MSQKEIKRIKVLELLVNGRMTNQEAAESLGLCRRQIIRLRKKYTAQGEMGLIHGNRDRRPQHRIGEWIRHDVLRLYREKYHDFNFSHFTDCLKEAEGIDISRSSVVRILTAEGFRSKKSVRRRAKLHRARPRKEAAGMLWQTDASKFEWFGKGKGYATLHAYIDDATGRVVGAWFTKNESTAGYVTALGIGLEHYGLPMEIYSDRHSMPRFLGIRYSVLLKSYPRRRKKRENNGL